jgi:serine/threonine protein kinase
VHRLINHRTVLIDNHGYIKLTHVHTVSLLPIGKTSLINFKQGDLCYLAPEMLYGNNEYSYAVDYWAVGVLMYLMICGKLPFGLSFEEENKSNIVGAILNEELVFPSNVIDENFKDFIMKILDKVEDKRLKSWDDVICHPFYKGFKYRDIEMMEMKKPSEIKIIKSEVNVYKNEKYLSYEEMNMFLYNHSNN